GEPGAARSRIGERAWKRDGATHFRSCRRTPKVGAMERGSGHHFGQVFRTSRRLLVDREDLSFARTLTAVVHLRGAFEVDALLDDQTVGRNFSDDTRALLELEA